MSARHPRHRDRRSFTQPAELAMGPLPKRRGTPAPALTGRFIAHHGFLLAQLLAHMDELEAHITQCNAKIEEMLRPFAQIPLEQLQTIPGVGQPAAEVILAEVGVDMSQFPTAARSRHTYLAGLHARLARRRGAKKAAFAAGHSILVGVWHVLRRGVPYANLGPSHFDQLNIARLTRHYLRRLEDPELQVTVQPRPEAA